MRRLTPLSSSRIPKRAAPPSSAASTISPARPAIRAAVTPGAPSPSMASFIRYGPAIWNAFAKTTSTRPHPKGFR